MPAAPDEKDWTIVLFEPCQECRQDVRKVGLEEIVAQLPQQVDLLLSVLERSTARERLDPARWSDQEYVVHVAQMLEVMVQRLNLMLREDSPTFPDWDQDKAAETGNFNSLKPGQAATQLRQAASDFTARLNGISPHDEQREGLRSNGAEFTIKSLAQYAWHDVLHHVWDVQVPG